MSAINRIADSLERITEVLEEQFLPQRDIDLTSAHLWEWCRTRAGQSSRLMPMKERAYLPLSLLCGFETERKQLKATLESFANGAPANNVLLWGSRGCGKSALAVASIASALEGFSSNLRLIEIRRECLSDLPILWDMLSEQPKDLRFVLFCDDLSFEANSEGDELAYKSLKSTLDGSLASRTNRVLLIATSNRRHLMPRAMTENERKAAIHDNESIDEKVSLSDRFGLWLGVQPHSQDMYLQTITNYLRWAGALSVLKPSGAWQKEALIWSVMRGSRSGRVAWQFFIDLCTRMDITIPPLPIITK